MAHLSLKFSVVVLLVTSSLGCTGRFRLKRGASSCQGDHCNSAGASANVGPSAAGAPTSFKLSTTNPTQATATWAAAGQDSDDGVAKQQLLFFGDGNSSCSGSPQVTIDVAADATSADWNRFAGGTAKNATHFLVRTIDRGGLQADSACSSMSIINQYAFFPGTANGMALGYSVSGANRPFYFEDVTGDGFNDLVVVSYNYTDNTGAIAVLPGGKNLGFDSMHMYTGDQLSDELGNLLRFADVNGDGIKDMISGSPAANPGGRTGAGSVYVIFGGSTLPASGKISAIGRRFDGAAASDAIGFSGYTKTNTIGDITGDGIDDIVVLGTNTAYANSTKTYIIVGSKTYPASGLITTATPHIYSSEFINDQVHVTAGSSSLYSGTEIRDFNYDGINDLVTFSGDAAGTAGNTSRGALWILPGAATLPAAGTYTTVGYKYVGNANNDRIGQSCFGSLGSMWVDMTNDGKPDFVSCGSSGGTDVGVNAGSVNILPAGSFPASGNFSTAGHRYVGVAASDRIGTNGWLGDVDGDAITDLILFGNSANGVIDIIRGGALPASGNIAIGNIRYGGVVGTAPISVTTPVTLADFNKDGYLDLIVNCMAANSGAATAGSIYVIIGGALLPGSTTVPIAATRRYDGTTATDNLGNNLVAGDITGDSIVDIISSNQNADPGGLTNAGSVYVIPGASSTAALPATGSITTAGYRYNGDANNDRLGTAFYLKDVTKDGVADIVAPSLNAGAGFTSGGSIYIIKGGALAATGAISTAGFRYNGEANNDSVGANFRFADFNGDGFDDIISSFGTAAGPSALASSGAVYVVPAAATLPPSGAISVRGYRYDGASASDYFGSSVSVVDVNKDGFLDIVSANPNAAGVGALYILPGASTLPASGTINARGKRFEGTVAGCQLSLIDPYAYAGSTGPIDYDGDGYLDFYLVCQQASASSKLFYIKGNKNIASMSMQKLLDTTTGDPGYLCNQAAGYDLNLDGQIDLLCGNATSMGDASDYGGITKAGGVHFISGAHVN